MHLPPPSFPEASVAPDGRGGQISWEIRALHRIR